MAEEELGDHGGPAGVPSGESVDMHGQIVQDTGADVIRPLPLHHLLDAGDKEDVQEQGCSRRDGKEGVNQA